MTKNTDRDLVWHQALKRAKNEESFQIDDIAQIEEIGLSKRTIRDTLRTLSDLGWLTKNSPRSHTWHPGRKIITDEIEHTEETTSDYSNAKSLDHIENATDFIEGQVYFGIVDRFSESGDGLIEIPSSHINVGEIDNSSKGEEICFKFVGGTYGLCLDKKYTPPGYSVPGVSSESD